MIRAGIVGYGNLGKSIVENLKKLPEEFEIVKIFTRRNPEDFGKKFESLDKIEDYKDKIDVLFLALGSATDIPEIAPKLARNFHTVDAYDNHKNISHYFENLEKIGKENNTLHIISTGWDPGLFSYHRMMMDALFSENVLNTFWGKGVSQGHSDAIKRIEGVEYAIQYTAPKKEILSNIKNLDRKVSSEEGHDRICYVVSKDSKENSRIEKEIKTMPSYFDKYNTIVNFISKEEFLKNHQGLSHGGHVIGVGKTANATKQLYDFNLELESNPEFTAIVNIMFGRALYKLQKENKNGALTIIDIPPIYLINGERKELIKKYV